MKRFLIIGAMVFLLAGMCIPAPASATYESDTRTLYDGEYLYFNLYWGNTGSLSYTVSASSGDPNFDVFFIDSSEYSNYKGGYNFDYHSACSYKDTRYAKKSCTVYSGSYYLIFDNTDVGPAEPYGDSVTLTYTVETSEGSGGNGGDDNSFLMYFICGFLGLFIIIVIIVVVFTRMKRKKSVAYKVPSSPAPSYQPSRTPTRTHAQAHYQQPGHAHSQAPPPQTPAGYKAAPGGQAYSPPPRPSQPRQPTGMPEAKQPEEPPKLVLPGMMGGTEDTLEDAYSGPPKPKQPPKF